MKVSGRVALLLSLLLPATPSVASLGADQCPEMRMDGPGGSMEHVTPRDQTQLESCYSFAASAMFDAFRFGHAPPRGDQDYAFQSSPVESLVAYAIASHTAIESGGIPCKLIGMLSKNGSCSHDKVVQVSGGLGADKFLEWLDQWHDYLRGNLKPSWFRRTFMGAPGFDPAVAGSPDFSEAARHFATDAYHCGGVDRRLEDLLPFSREKLAATAAWSTGLPFQELALEGVCGTRKRVSGVACAETPAPKNPEEALNQINGFLTRSQPAQPVGVRICGNILDNRPDAQTGSWVDYQKHRVTSDCRGAHDVVVMGRRFKAGKCQFLLRNSWGTSCNAYEGLDCEPGKGNIWVDSDAVARNTYDTYYLE